MEGEKGRMELAVHKSKGEDSEGGEVVKMGISLRSYMSC